MSITLPIHEAHQNQSREQREQDLEGKNMMLLD